jgi:DNA-binding NarL/FixJ family response regulator
MIADDDELVCEALADLIANEPIFKVVGIARDAEEAIKLGCHLRPDAAIIDVRMPKGGGVRVATELTRCAPGIKILALSAEPEKASEQAMAAAGAVKYLTKGVIGGPLLDALRDVVSRGSRS